MNSQLVGGNRKPGEITVCDIMGEWGAYQWSISFFALIYSALFGVVVVIPPIWTPDMSFVCAPSNYSQMTALQREDYVSRLNFSAKPHECMKLNSTFSSSSQSPEDFSLLLTHLPIDKNSVNYQQLVPCETFIYDDSKFGKVLTNSVSITLGHSISVTRSQSINFERVELG